MVDPIEKQWEENSRAYAELIGGKGTPHHQLILNPCVEKLLGDVSGKNLLDAGCGEGYLSRYYTEKGALVTGVDISGKLIEMCKNQSPGNVKYNVGNICDLDFIDDETFDLILCNLVLLNIPCFDDALKEFYRVLRFEGGLIFSVVHPAFNFYGPGTWEMGERDPETRRRKGLFFKVDQYFEEKDFQGVWQTREGDKFPKPISFFHRTLSTYVNAVSEAGLEIVRIEEPRSMTEDKFFDRENRIPFFLVVKARKTSGSKT
jgi:ubiquinone/menaquinone biosynthesis C-methylase UbiE